MFKASLTSSLSFAWARAKDWLNPFGFHPGEHNWVAVKELQSNYHNVGTYGWGFGISGSGLP